MKSFADPHVRILGRPNDVLKAKDRILAALDSRVRLRTKFIISFILSFSIATGLAAILSVAMMNVCSKRLMRPCSVLSVCKYRREAA